MYRAILHTKIGMLHLLADDVALRRISFSTELSHPILDAALDNHPVLDCAQTQLAEYFAGQRRHFDLPLSPQGTPFQQAVWEVMLQIPYGRTTTYRAIAAELGHPNKARAVGGAANRNPLPIVIPCHRVIGTSGQLTGFSGGLEIKRFLLNLESSCVDHGELIIQRP